MDSAELSEWYALHRFISPLGGAWEQASLIASWIANTRLNRDPDSFVFEADHFMPIERDPVVVEKQEQTAEEMQEIGRVVTQILQGQ